MGHDNCLDCVWWNAVPEDWQNEFVLTGDKWGMCELASNNEDYKLTDICYISRNKVMPVCNAEGLIGTELMTRDIFSCSEFSLVRSDFIFPVTDKRF